jgi:hypothetical protein
LLRSTQQEDFSKRKDEETETIQTRNILSYNSNKKGRTEKPIEKVVGKIKEPLTLLEQNEKKKKKKLDHTMSTTHGKPIEGMECYCNMEDITEEDGNYGTNTYTMYTTLH